MLPDSGTEAAAEVEKMEKAGIEFIWTNSLEMDEESGRLKELAAKILLGLAK